MLQLLIVTIGRCMMIDMAVTMVPPSDLLPDVLPTERLNARAMPVRPLRDELRRIPTVRNAITVVMALVQTFGVVIAAVVVDTWWAWVAAFVLMGRGHCLLNILGHEAAHRLLFPNRRVNDFVGRWLLAYPTFQAFIAYRRAHFAHHRDELGPDEPDLGLYRGYPIPADSWHRKLRRDIARRERVRRTSRPCGGRSGRRQPEALQILAVAGRAARRVDRRRRAAGLRRVDRLVEHAVEVLQPAAGDRRARRHGALARPPPHDPRDPPEPLARFCMVPYHTGWHLAHHVDMGVPWRNLPRLHDELVRSGWIVPDIEYPSYRAFWRACSAGQPGPRQPVRNAMTTRS